MKENLKRLFDYDLWANLRWSEALPSFADSSGEKIVRHVLDVQRTWYSRCLNEVDEVSDDTPLAEGLETMNRLWKDLIEISDPSAYIAFTASNGESSFSLLSDIAWQVLHHGTYHRGHLRGMAESLGLEFPETDFLLFAKEN